MKIINKFYKGFDYYIKWESGTSDAKFKLKGNLLVGMFYIGILILIIKGFIFLLGAK